MRTVMSERSLDHFAECARLFRGPVPEVRPEPMRHGGATAGLEQFRQHHVGSLEVFPVCGTLFTNKTGRSQMAKTEMIRARVEPDLKCQAEEVFAGLGLSPTEAITLFYRQVTLHHGLPFAVKVPNAETIAALRQARVGKGLTEYADLEDLKARHG